MDDDEEKILIAKCLQLKTWRELGESFKVYKTLLKAVQKIWKALYEGNG